MKKRTFTAFAAFALLLTLLGGCAPDTPTDPAAAEDGSVHVLATTYPVYLLTTALTDGIDGAEVTLLVNSQTSCLHDYTLTVPDMKAIEGADVIVMNGAGMEEFMSDALSRSEAAVIDSSVQVELLTMGAHAHDQDGNEAAAEGGEAVPDPHIWMDPDNALKMLEAIAEGLAKADPVFASVTGEPLTAARAQLTQGRDELVKALSGLPADRRNLVTFHDGFHYFAHAFDLNLLKSIEEEEGSEASAADIRDIVDLVNEYQLPAIFTEKKGSTATADAISRETGCKVAQLDMMMSGEGFGIQGYLDVLSANVNAIAEALK